MAVVEEGRAPGKSEKTVLNVIDLDSTFSQPEQSSPGDGQKQENEKIFFQPVLF